MRDLKIVEYKPDLESAVIDLIPNAEPATGREVLVSKIVKLLLTRKGTNVFNPEYGNPFYDLLVRDYTGKKEELEASIPLYLETISDNIKIEQNSFPDLLPSEKLLNLELVGVSYEEAFGAWVILIDIITEDSQSSIIRI